MQLFITPYIQQGSSVVITEERVVHQLKNVLRSKTGSEFRIQNIIGDTIARLTISINDIHKDKIIGTIINKEEIIFEQSQKYLFVALPNKFEKMEWIVQKCTEIGLHHIIFFSSQYSQLREVSENKLERLSKIALEAVEQSYGAVVPEITFTKSITPYLSKGKNILLHQDGITINSITINSLEGPVNFFIGPEGGRGSEDEKIFLQHEVQKISLGKNILRTETAAIVVAWEAINN